MFMDIIAKNIETVLEWVNDFHSTYKFDSTYYTKKNKKVYLGTKVNQVCRFCGRSTPGVTFKNVAHAIPQFMGNNYVISNYECDSCNKIFGIYENDLASFIGLRAYLVTSNELKKKKKLKLPNNNGGVYRSKNWNVLVDPNNETFELLEDGKTQRCKLSKKPFKPLNVCKALAKIALSLLNDEASSQFQKTYRFLISDELDNDEIVQKFAKLSLLYIGDLYLPCPIVFTYRKKEGLEDLEEQNGIIYPHKTFIIYWNQFCFQIMLPFDIDDNKITQGERILFKCFPPILTEPTDQSRTHIYESYLHNFRDLSSKEKIIGERDEFFITVNGQFYPRELTDDEISQIVNKFGLREIIR